MMEQTDNQQQRKENQAHSVLGTERIGKLLKSYALPAIIAMTASSLYNMVDSIFIGQGVGALAISGLAVTFPLMNLSTAFGTLVGVGGATILSILLGQKNYNGASKVLGNIVSLNLIIGTIFMAVALVFLDPILTFFGASVNTLPYAREYMQVILYGNAISHVYFGLNSAMRASGNPKLAMGLTLFTVIFNTILDPIMIFGMGMGIKGAAWATVISQTIAMIIIVSYFSNHKNFPHFEKGIIRLDWRIARDSLEIGFGPFLMNSAACLVNLFINQQLGKYSGDMGIGSFGINNRITFLFLMVCMGLNQGMQPIAGYNYGARKYSRVLRVYKLTAVFATITTFAGFIVSVFLPHLMVGIFTHDGELAEMSVHGLRIMNSIFFIVGYQIVSTNLFQSLGMVSKSIFLSLSRQLLCLVPLVYLLPLWLGADGVWFSFPLSDAFACILTIIMTGRLVRKFRKLKDGDDPSSLGGIVR